MVYKVYKLLYSRILSKTKCIMWINSVSLLQGYHHIVSHINLMSEYHTILQSTVLSFTMKVCFLVCLKKNILKDRLGVSFSSTKFHLVNSNSTSNISIPIPFLTYSICTYYHEYLLGIPTLNNLYSK